MNSDALRGLVTLATLAGLGFVIFLIVSPKDWGHKPRACTECPGTTTSSNAVHITPGSSGWSTCSVNPDPVCLTVANGDEVHWCANSPYPHEVDVEFKDPSAPFADQHGAAKHGVTWNPTSSNPCSESLFGTGTSSTCRHYRYRISTSETSTPCLDPKVILK